MATLGNVATRYQQPCPRRDRTKALAKIPDFPTYRNVHGLRKLCATILTQAGCSTHEIGRVTGRRTLAMIQHYTNSVGQQASAEAAMAKLNCGGPRPE